MSSKDWTGGQQSIWKTIGASNHTENEREPTEYYATSPEAIDKLRKAYDIPHFVWECSCGEGHLSKRLLAFGHQVYSSDLIDRGYGVGGKDFLLEQSFPWNGYDLEDCCILTNPPFKTSVDFIEHAVYQFRERLLCAKNGDFEGMIKGGGGAVSYAFYLFMRKRCDAPKIYWI